jgi:hypothetical protein
MIHAVPTGRRGILGTPFHGFHPWLLSSGPSGAGRRRSQDTEATRAAGTGDSVPCGPTLRWKESKDGEPGFEVGRGRDQGGVPPNDSCRPSRTARHSGHTFPRVSPVAIIIRPLRGGAPAVPGDIGETWSTRCAGMRSVRTHPSMERIEGWGTRILGLGESGRGWVTRQWGVVTVRGLRNGGMGLPGSLRNDAIVALIIDSLTV